MKCTCGFDVERNYDIPEEYDRCPNCDERIVFIMEKSKWEKPKVGHLVMTKWGWLCSYPENLIIGENSDIGAFCYLQAYHGIFIGKDVQIGSHCSIYSQDTIGKKAGKVILNDGCCIGTHSVVMPGVEIGAGLIIPAFSFVKRSILDEEALDNFKQQSRPMVTVASGGASRRWL